MTLPTPEQIQQLWDIHNGPERARENLLRSYGFDSTSTWRDSRGFTLSDRIWRARRAVRDQIDLVLRQAIANGTDALEVAEILEAYLNPEFAPVRDAFGRIIRNKKIDAAAAAHNKRKIINTRWPGRGGMGSFSARRLARTEISRAHAQATIRAAIDNPFVDHVRYAVSNRHPKPDECSDVANRDSGNGPGVYEIADAPTPPLHPQCLCRLEPVVTSDVDQVVSDLRSKYDL